MNLRRLEIRQELCNISAADAQELLIDAREQLVSARKPSIRVVVVLLQELSYFFARYDLFLADEEVFTAVLSVAADCSSARVNLT